MKTKEELNALKEEVETVNRKLHELTEEELAQVTGGAFVQSSTCYHPGFAALAIDLSGSYFIGEVSCRQCVHWMGAEGPCELD